MLTKGEFFEVLDDTIRATKGQFGHWRLNEYSAWDAYREDPARFHAKSQDNPTGHVGVAVVYGDGPWWEPDFYLALDTEHDLGSVSIIDHEGMTIETLGEVAWETDVGSPTAATIKATERLAVKVGWLVCGDWDVVADSYCAPVKRIFLPVTA
jgi:hypothetical protein